MYLLSSRDCPVGASNYDSSGVADGEGKCGVIPRTIHLTSQNIDFWIGGGNFFS